MELRKTMRIRSNVTEGEGQPAIVISTGGITVIREVMLSALSHP